MTLSKKQNDDNTLGMLAHLLSIFSGFIGPLIIYILTKDKKQKNANENAKHAFNFQISLLIYMAISAVLMLILIGFLLLWALGIFALIAEIIGTVKAYQGEVYSYPLEIKFLK